MVPATPWALTTAQLVAVVDEDDFTDRMATLVALQRFYAWAITSGLIKASPLDALTLGVWDLAVVEFAEHLDRLDHPSAATRADYARRVFTYGRELPCGPWELTSHVLCNDLDGRNWSAATRKATLVALRRFYAWAILAGRVERSPLLGVPDGAPKRPGPLMQHPADAWAVPIRDFLTTLRAAGRRPGTIRIRRTHLTVLSHLIACPWQVNADDLSEFLSREDWSPEYRRSVRGTVRVFYKWAVLSDRIARDPSTTLAAVNIPRTLPRPAPDDAVLDALESADHRTRLAVELGMYAGLRVGEVACLQDADVLPNVLRVTGKGGHQRMVPIHPTLAASLSAERSRRAGAGVSSPWLFPSRYGGHLSAQYLCRLVSDVLPGGWTHHTLRHRFATQAYASARDLRAVQELLGHSRPETTARYAAVPERALTDAVAGVGLPLDRNRKVDQ